MRLVASSTNTQTFTCQTAAQAAAVCPPRALAKSDGGAECACPLEAVTHWTAPRKPTDFKCVCTALLHVSVHCPPCASRRLLVAFDRLHRPGRRAAPLSVNSKAKVDSCAEDAPSPQSPSRGRPWCCWHQVLWHPIDLWYPSDPRRCAPMRAAQNAHLGLWQCPRPSDCPTRPETWRPIGIRHPLHAPSVCQVPPIRLSSLLRHRNKLRHGQRSRRTSACNALLIHSGSAVDANAA